MSLYPHMTVLKLALEEIVSCQPDLIGYRFYAASSSAVGKKTSPSSRRSGESDEKEVACADPINSRNDEDRTQNHPPSDFDKRSPLPQHSEVVATSPTKTFMEDALVSAPPDIEKRDEKLATDVADGIAQSLVEPTTPPATPDHLALDPPPLADGVDGNFGAKASDGDVLTRGGRRESSDGVQRRHTPLLAAGTPMNSMADALSHRSLLHFAADFGISGALLSALEVGEIFFSCEGGPKNVSRFKCLRSYTVGGHRFVWAIRKNPTFYGC